MKNYQKLDKTNIADLLCDISDGATDCMLDILEPSVSHAEICSLSNPEYDYGIKNPCHKCICKWLNEDVKS